MPFTHCLIGDLYDLYNYLDLGWFIKSQSSPSQELAWSKLPNFFPEGSGQAQSHAVKRQGRRNRLFEVDSKVGESLDSIVKWFQLCGF